MEIWCAKRQEVYDKHPRWAKDCQTLPSVQQINEWSTDSVCESVNGNTVEPDYTGSASDQSPSWLVALGYI